MSRMTKTSTSLVPQHTRNNTMPNYCNNGLELLIKNDCPEIRNAVHSEIVKLINGSLINRFETIQIKLRKIALAGAAGLLKPHQSIDIDTFNYLNEKTNHIFNTSERRNSDSSIAYTEFLNAITSVKVSPNNFDYWDDLYNRVGIHSIYWGDIPRNTRAKMKALIKYCGYDYGIGFRGNPEVYWSHNALERVNESKAGMLDFKMLTSIPVDTIVNGFNGYFFCKKGRTAIQSVQSGYDFNCTHFGVKWEIVSVDNTNDLIEDSTEMVLKFSTPWNEPNGLPSLVREYLVEKVNSTLNTNFDESIIEVNLYFSEPGCAFQGINDDVWEYNIDWNDEGEEYQDNLDERIYDKLW